MEQTARRNELLALAMDAVDAQLTRIEAVLDDIEMVVAFERREREGIESELAAAEKAAVRISEQNRVKHLINNDNAERSRERMRKQAEMEVRDGVFVNLADTVVEPTEEWKRHHDSRPYSPPQPNGTVRKISTVRRVVTPVVLKLYRNGRVTDDQYRACCWYRDTFEEAGMDGCYVTTSFSDAGGGGSGPSLRAHLAATERQAEAKQLWRKARAAIHADFIQFFDLIVLRDYTPRNASKFVRVSERRADSHFRGLCEDLIEFIDSMGIELKPLSDGED